MRARTEIRELRRRVLALERFIDREISGRIVIREHIPGAPPPDENTLRLIERTFGVKVDRATGKVAP